MHVTTVVMHRAYMELIRYGQYSVYLGFRVYYIHGTTQISLDASWITIQAH